jgi:predicted DNA-binding transcriptional regulator YafY
MNRTDRLLALVLELQAKGQQRAEDLAQTFEVSKRTIYRDMLALSESGVPVVSMPGQGYSLMEGYFLPPLSFTTDEAIMLLLGSDFVAQNFDAQYRSAAYAASRKIEVVLPDELRHEVRYLQSSIRFLAATPPTGPETLQQLRRAIIQRKSVRFQYYSRFSASEKNTPEVRDADPYGLIHINGTWMLMAYCHLRQDRRNFRLDRIENLQLLDTIFKRPADFKIEQRGDSDRGLTVRILVDHEAARWAHEAHSFYQVDEEIHPDGSLVTLQIRHEQELVQWLLGWGSHIRILEPDSLRQLLAHEAEKMLKNYS